MSYIFVVDDDHLTEERWNKFVSGKDCLVFHRNSVCEARIFCQSYISLDEYCQDYADKLHEENMGRLNRLSASEREEVFYDDPGIKYRATPSILFINKPSEVKKRLDDYEKGIKVGDVVLFPFYGDILKGLVTKRERASTCDCETVHVIQKNGATNLCLLESCEKTEEHYDSIDAFMKGE